MKSGSVMAVVALTLLVTFTHSQEKPPAGDDQTEGSAKKLQELRTEQIETLEKAVDQYTTLFKATRVTIADVWEAQRLLIVAKLDAAETDEDRIKHYNALVALLKALETHAEAQAQAGREIPPNVLKAKARRLEAEIQLEQTKLKLVKSIK